MKHVVLSGGAGFIGSHLCDHLLKKGYMVTCADNFITGNERNITHLRGRGGFKLLRRDISSGISVPGKVDYVLNFASPASPVDYLEHPIETLEVGSLGTRNMLNLAREKKAVFMQASTSEVYGDPLVNPQPETYWGNVNPIGVRSVYDEAKRFSEALTMAYHRAHRVDVRIARIFNTYGPRMRLNDGRVVPNFIYQALNSQRLTVYGDGKQTRSFCYVSDLVEGVYRLMRSSYDDPINLGNPNEMTMLEFADAVIRMTGSKGVVVFKPLPSDDPKVRCPDISRAMKILKWKPAVGLEEGLEKTIRWFKEHPEMGK
jgi:dTDP-glucose 4,6-dehydratase